MKDPSHHAPATDPSRHASMAGHELRREPWPFALGAALLSMIAVSLTFFWIATSYPDVELLDADARPGLSATGDDRVGD